MSNNIIRDVSGFGIVQGGTNEKLRLASAEGLKQIGFEEVYQIDGGIVKYGETYKVEGEWEGKLYVFDERQVVGFSDQSQDIGSCGHCQNKTSNYVNCANKQCNKLVLVCADCAATEYCVACVPVEAYLGIDS